MDSKLSQESPVPVLHSEFDCLWTFPEETNVVDYILRKVQEHCDANRQTCVENATTGESYTFPDFLKFSQNIASHFVKLGLQPGDTVIYTTHNPAKVHMFLLGIWRANGIVRSSYPEDGDHILRSRILESRAKFLACDSQNAPEALRICATITEWSCQVIMFNENDNDLHPDCIPIHNFFHDDGTALPTEITGTLDSVCLILPTSGTTGDSKGAIYTHRILLENLCAFECMPFTDSNEKPTIITSRQTHFVGSIVGLSFFTRGRYLLTFSSVSVEGLLEAVEKYKVRAIVGFPKYLTGLVNHPLATNYDTSSLHYLASAGQVIGPETLAVIKQLENLKTFINLYGMTEAGLLVTTANWAALKNGKFEAVQLRDYTVGKLPPKTSLKVVDIESGQVVGANCKGELLFKTAVRVAGYLNKVEETQDTFLVDGWVKTGDVGYYDEEGYIYIVDRAKEIFKWFNNHISPSEIENLLLRHPSISEAVVIGVTDPDGGGHIARGFVVLRQGKTTTVEELLLFAKNNLPPYKHLKGGLFILPNIPVGKTGKVSRKLFTQLQLPTDPSA